MRKSRSAFFVIAPITIIVSACTAMPITFGQMQWVDDPQPFIAYGALNRDLKVDVYGNPFAESAAQVTSVLIAGLQAGFPWTRFSTRPDGSARADFRVVVAFDSRDNAPTLCSRPRPAAAAATNTGPSDVSVQAVLCEGEKPLTEVSGRVGDLAGAGDPRFATLMRHVAVDLFPSDAPGRV